MNLSQKLRDLATQAEKASKEAVAKAGELAHDRRDSISTGIDKVATTIDSKTDGKYSDKVAKAKTQVSKGVDKIADQRPNKPTDDDNPPDPTAYEPPAR